MWSGQILPHLLHQSFSIKPQIPLLPLIFTRLGSVTACQVHQELHHLDLETSNVVKDPCVRLISLCSSSKYPSQAVCIHSPIVKLGLHYNLLLCNNLLSCYSKCNKLDEVSKLFDELPSRDVITWTTIISAYGRRGNSEEAITFLRLMLAEDSPTLPNEFTFSSVIRSLSFLGSLDIGKQVHALVLKCGFGTNEVIGSTLLDFYSKCGKLEDARKIFALMNYKDVVSWTAMISAFIEVGDLARAMELYMCMLKSRVAPTEFTFSKLLTSCGCFNSLHCGLVLHAHLILWGLELNIVLKTALMDMYLKCHKMLEGHNVFLQTPESDVMLWTAMISGYILVECYREAIAMFRQMENAGVAPSSFTYAGVLSSCSSAPEVKLGEQIHCRMIKTGLEHDESVGNALMDFYTKCSMVPEKPIHAFTSITFPNVVSWTTLITALIHHGFEEKAALAFIEMRVAGVEPNSFTLSTILKGCSSLQALPQIEKLHAYIIKMKAVYSNMAVGNALVDAYARHRRLDEAWVIAKMMMPCRDVLTYTSLSKGFNQIGFHKRALDMISCMHEEEVTMDGFSLACFLSSAANLTAIECGKQLHSHAFKSGLLSWISVSNGIVDMYAKCGRIEEAQVSFMSIQEPNVVSWNGLISGLASNGRFSEALAKFEDMRLARTQPDGITFLLVLYACSHGGLVDFGIEYFNSMEELYGVEPEQDHYICIVDMLGRAGRLEEAVCTVDTMPFKPDSLIYKTLLASCKQHSNLVLGEYTAGKALELDPSDPAIYVLLAGIYDDAGKLKWGEQIRRMMRERAVMKCPGQSWMEMRG